MSSFFSHVSGVTEGLSTNNESERIEFLDTSQLDNHPSMRFGHTVSLVGRELYIFGGFDGENCSNSMVVFNTRRDEWEREFYINDDISERYYHSCCTTGGLIYIHGGRVTEGGRVLNDIFSFNPVNKEFRKITTKNQSPFLYGHKMVALGEYLIYFIGGKNEKSRYSRSVFYFNIQTKRFQEAVVESLEKLQLPQICHHQIVTEESADILNVNIFQGITPNLEEEEEEEGEVEQQPEPDVLRIGVFSRITLDAEAELIVILEEVKARNPNKTIFINSLFQVQDVLHNHIYCVGSATPKKRDDDAPKMNIYRLQENDDETGSNYEWSKRSIADLNDYRPFFRPHHTSTECHGKVYIFGGQVFFDGSRKRKTVMETELFHEFMMAGDSLALDVVVVISTFLPFRDVLNLCHVSKEWRVSQHMKNDVIWKRLFEVESSVLGNRNQSIENLNIPLEEELRRIEEDQTIKFKYFEKYMSIKRRTNLWELSKQCYIGHPSTDQLLNFKKMEGKYRKYVLKRRSAMNVSCCMVGDKGIGKRSIIERLKKGRRFDPEYIGAIGELYNYQMEVGGFQVVINFKDNTGFEGYDRLIELTYKNFRVFIVAFDMTDRKSFENVEDQWMNDIVKYRDTTLTTEVILVGTKKDLYDRLLRNKKKEEENLVSPEEVIEYVRERPEISFYLETSSHQDVNVSRGKVIGKLVFAAHMLALYKSEMMGKRKSKKQIDDDCKIL